MGFQLGGGLGVTTIPAVHKVHVLAIVGGHHQAGHHRVIGQMHAVFQFPPGDSVIQVCAYRFDAVGRTIEHHAQAFVGAGKIQSGDDTGVTGYKRVSRYLLI